MRSISPKDGWILITGAGSGLGRAMAVRLCGEGFTVAGIGRREDALTETAEICGAHFHACPCDMADAGATRALVAGLVAAHGPMAVLINNAAVYPRRDVLDETGESFAATVAVNLGGVMNCTRAALDGMTESGRGRILNVSTFADIAPLPASSAYAVSKGAARILTRALIADLADRFPGIVISDWMPGMLKTTMGVPEGIAPEASAVWGAKLALMANPDLTGSVFEMDREILPPRGLKGRVKDLLLLRRRKPRVL